jgi:hypothetical protein
MPGEQKWALTPHDRSAAQPRREQMVNPGHSGRVDASDRRHLDDLALDELDPVVLAEDAGLAHPVIFIQREAPTLELDRHVFLAAHHVVSPPRRRQCREMDTRNYNQPLSERT